MIYFIPQGTEFVKIGYTDGSITSRLCSLQPGNPHKLEVLLTIGGAQRDEDLYHGLFSVYHVRGEWYHLTKAIQAFIKEREQEKQAISAFISSNYSKLEVLRSKRGNVA